MECRDVRALADSYLSEQLLVETTHTVVEHLERCQACRAEFDGRRRLRATLRSAFGRARDLEPRPEFLERLHARVREAGRSAGVRASRWQRGLAMAACVVLVVGLAAGATRWLSLSVMNRLAHLAAGDHQNCALKFRLPERPITLVEAARSDPAFRRLETLQHYRAVLGDGAIRFVEHHACVYKGQLFAHIVFTYRGSAVSVLVADARGSRRGTWWHGADVHEGPSVGTFNLSSFHSGGHDVFVVSTLPAEDVQEVARAIATPVSDALGGL